VSETNDQEYSRDKPYFSGVSNCANRGRRKLFMYNALPE